MPLLSITNKECSKCGGDNFYHSFESFVRNRCRHCKEILFKNLEGKGADEFISFAFGTEFPKEVPNNCSECDFFAKRGILDKYFYNSLTT